MFLIERVYTIAGIRVRQVEGLFQTGPKIVFLLLVKSWATRLVDQAQQVLGLRVAQRIPHAGIELGRLAIALPSVVPFVLSLKKRRCRGVDAIFVRISRANPSPNRVGMLFGTQF